MTELLKNNFWENYWRERNQELVFRHKAALGFINKGPVLDLGCGDGFFLSKLREKNIDGAGLDLSEEAVKKAREKGLKAEVFDFSSAPLPFQDNSFEAVVLLDVLEYFCDPSFVLKEAKRAAKSLIISLPNSNSLPSRLQVLLGKMPENCLHKRGYTCWISYSFIKDLLDENKLRIVDMKVNSFFSKKPILKNIMHFLAKIRPSVFALTFVIKAEK